MKARLQALRKSAGVRHGFMMAAAMILAGGLDYAVNVLAGRWLVPVEYGVFIAVAAILQILVQLTNTIRNVMAFYTAELKAQGALARLGEFMARALRWGWRWGIVGTAVLAILSPPLASLLHLPNAWPMWAACPAVLMFFVRCITDGGLQGTQSFTGFGLVQVTQSFLRLVLAALFIWLGYQSAGAIVALPLACALSLAVAFWFLRPYLRKRGSSVAHSVNWHYSAYTLLGLSAFAILTNLDAVFVKRFFSPHVAGNYAPVVTLAKISLFAPLALGIVMFPKVTQRQVAGRDPRPILMMALTATLIPGLALTLMFFSFPSQIVKLIFTGAYADPGAVLGLATLAATLYAGLNIWLNYALSLERPAFVFALAVVLVTQVTCMFAFCRQSLLAMTTTMVAGGVGGHIAGFVTAWSVTPKPARVTAGAIEL
jgi:O-antigen/teichoic acid export membrane protein